VNNLTTQIFERVDAEISAAPETLQVARLGGADRVLSYVSYLASADHFTQVQKNEQLAQACGIR
jgi:hypothetical protein